MPEGMVVPDPGAFRHVVTVQRRVTSLDGIGGASDSWPATSWTKLRAAVEFVGGSEGMKADQPGAERSSKVTTWYLSDVGPRDRLAFDGRTLEVVSVGDPTGERRIIEMMCRGGV